MRNTYEKTTIAILLKKKQDTRQVKRLERNDVEIVDNVKKDQEGIMKRTIKDSVFTDLFQDKKYLLQLYKSLHPEDTDVTENDLNDITIKNVLTDNIYNDLGFTVGDKLMILVEAQSSVWTVNIIVRALMYLVQTWHDYFERTKQNLYKSKKCRCQSRRYTSYIHRRERTRPSRNVKVPNPPGSGKDTAEAKGVHREVESEERIRQNSGLHLRLNAGIRLPNKPKSDNCTEMYLVVME